MNKLFQKARISSLLMFFTLMLVYINQAEAIPATGLNIIKTHQGNFTVGQEEVFTIVVSAPSIGETPVSDITVIDTLPAGFSFVRASGNNWSASSLDSTVTLTYSESLTTGDSTTIYLTVIASTPGTFTNTATATGIAGGVLPTVTAIDTVIVSDYSVLSLSMTHKKQFVVGQERTFNIYVGNIGSQAINEPLTVINTLPREMKFIKASGDGWRITQRGQTIVMQYSSALLAGEVAPVINLRVKPKVAGLFTNSVLVSTQTATNVASDTVKVVEKNRTLNLCR